MRALVAVLLAIALPAVAGPRIKRGVVVSRTSKSGVEYAVFLPARFKKGLPLLIHITAEQKAPAKYLGHDITKKESALQEIGMPAVHCAIAVKGTNVEGPHTGSPIDFENYVRLLKRDFVMVAEVFDELAQDVPFDRDAVAVTGTAWATEAAFAVATRMPDRITAVLIVDPGFSPSATRGLRLMPEGRMLARAQHIPVMVARSTLSPHGGEIEVMLIETLRDNGFAVSKGIGGQWRGHVNRDLMDWFVAKSKTSTKRRRLLVKRDALLAEAREQAAKTRLDGALRKYRAARKLEEQKKLDASSADVYAELEKAGRAMLEEVKDADEKTKQKRRKLIARLFKGLPLEAEAKG